jgi:hypothetical protein
LDYPKSEEKALGCPSLEARLMPSFLCQARVMVTPRL